MGQAVTTPLSLTLQHWKDVRDTAHNLSVKIRKGKWTTFCSEEWPTFGVGWPRDGTFNLDIISQVKAKIIDLGPHGHPDQVPYITTWEYFALYPPACVKPFVSPKSPPSPSAPTLHSPLQPVSAPALPSQSSLYPTQLPSKIDALKAGRDRTPEKFRGRWGGAAGATTAGAGSRTAAAAAASRC